jgi:lipopolysaccharide transport system permease protein
MSVRYLAASAEVVPGGGAIVVRLRLRNAGQGGADAALGYQIFDPTSGLFIAEGEWQALPSGDDVEAALDIRLPRERGEYRVYVSPVEANAGWQYQRGDPFLVVDAAVESNGVRVLRSRITTLRRLRRESLRRSLGLVFVHPWRTVACNWSLIRSLVRRDILGRYRGSFGGVFWTILNPLLLMLTYFFVFGIVLRTRFGNDPSRTGFVLYFLAGMLPWLAFSEAVGRAPYVVLEHRNFVKKLVFPVEVLPVVQTIAGLVTQAFALGIFVIGLLAARGAVPATALWLPLLLIPQLMLTLGVAWFLAALGVFVRDLGQINGFLLTLWFFLTPICYPEASLDKQVLWIFSKNPLFVLVRGYRAIFLEGQAPAFSPLWKLWIVSAVVLLVGHAWFYKLRKTFADVI